MLLKKIISENLSIFYEKTKDQKLTSAMYLMAWGNAAMRILKVLKMARIAKAYKYKRTL